MKGQVNTSMITSAQNSFDFAGDEPMPDNLP